MSEELLDESWLGTVNEAEESSFDELIVGTVVDEISKLSLVELVGTSLVELVTVDDWTVLSCGRVLVPLGDSIVVLSLGDDVV